MPHCSFESVPVAARKPSVWQMPRSKIIQETSPKHLPTHSRVPILRLEDPCSLRFETHGGRRRCSQRSGNSQAADWRHQALLRLGRRHPRLQRRLTKARPPHVAPGQSDAAPAQPALWICPLASQSRRRTAAVRETEPQPPDICLLHDCRVLQRHRVQIQHAEADIWPQVPHTTPSAPCPVHPLGSMCARQCTVSAS